MNRRPRSITIISWLFIAAGSIGLLYHLSQFSCRSPFDYGLVAILLIRLAAILAGVFMLRGVNWSRWLLVIWLVYHVVLSGFHSVAELGMHALLFGTIAFFLFRRQSSAYFRGVRGPSPQ
jgi:hypothetical protein